MPILIILLISTGTVLTTERPVSIDPTLTTLAPINLEAWLAEHNEELTSNGSKNFWEGKEFSLDVYKDNVNMPTIISENEASFFFLH